ncbi:helix-turn-helix transcriptional regulator [Planctomycetota bacterium]
MCAKQQVCETQALLNVRQVASMLGISQRTVWRLKDAGKLPPPVHLGSSVRWNRQSLNQFLEVGCDMHRYEAI